MTATALKTEENCLTKYVPQWERPVVRFLIKTLLDNGYTVSVNDGEETTVKRSDHFKTIVDAMGTSGEDYIFFQDGKTEGDNGYFYLIYDNGSAPDDRMIVICDYSANEQAEEIYREVNNKYTD